MGERNLLDDIDEIEQARNMTPEERLAATLDLSDFCLSLGRGNPDADPESRLDSLEEKARLLAAPLRILAA